MPKEKVEKESVNNESQPNVLKLLNQKSISSLRERKILRKKMLSILPTTRCKSIYPDDINHNRYGEEHYQTVQSMGKDYKTYYKTKTKSKGYRYKIIKNTLSNGYRIMDLATDSEISTNSNKKAFGKVQKENAVPYSIVSAKPNNSIPGIIRKTASIKLTKDIRKELNKYKIEGVELIDNIAQPIKTNSYLKYVTCCNFDHRVTWVHLPINWLFNCIHILEAVDDAVKWSCFEPLFKIVRDDYKSIQNRFPELYPICDMPVYFQDPGLNGLIASQSIVSYTKPKESIKDSKKGKETKTKKKTV